MLNVTSCEKALIELSISSNNDYINTEPFRTITLALLRIYPPLFVIIGTIGNILSFYVVLRSKLRKNSTFIYLAVLSIIDLLVLYTFCFNFMIHSWFQIDIQQYSLFACKLYSFSIYFFPQASAWILTAVSLDRVIALTRVRKPKNTRLTYITLLIIFTFLFLLNVQFFFYDNKYSSSKDKKQTIKRSSYTDVSSSSHGITWHDSLASSTLSIENSSQYNNRGDFHIVSSPSSSSIYHLVDDDIDINVVQCSSEHNNKYRFFYYNVWIYIDATINVYLPFTLMFLCSIVIFISVVTTMTDAHNSNKRIVAKNLSVMLLSVNAMFALLTAPIVFYLMFEQKTFSSNSILKNKCNLRLKAKYKMIKLICIILMNANHTGNILVYCLTGTEFRKHFFNVIGIWFQTNSQFKRKQYLRRKDCKRLSTAQYCTHDSGGKDSDNSGTSIKKQKQHHHQQQQQQQSSQKPFSQTIINDLGNLNEEQMEIDEEKTKEFSLHNKKSPFDEIYYIDKSHEQHQMSYPILRRTYVNNVNQSNRHKRYVLLTNKDRGLNQSVRI